MPLYLGVRCVIAKSFARIHAANLVNAGILPLTFANADDYDKLRQDDKLKLVNVFKGLQSGQFTLLDETTGDTIPLIGHFTDRQQAILRAGGLLDYTREGGK